VLILYAGTNAFLDDIPVERCLQFEAELYRHVENGHPEILSTIREKKAIDDALKAQIEAVLKDFKQQFIAEHKLSK
jgi:F-type H+/Na+-transporting ATPase subunit alpha